MKSKVLIPAGIITLIIGIFAYFSINTAQPIGPSAEPEPEKRPEIESNGLLFEGNAPVYVTFYSHNEDSWQYKVNSQKGFLDYRDGLRERADIFAQYDIPWNWQTDQPVLDAMLEYEDYETLTYIQERGASLDPHAHKNNYADIAHLMGVLGGTASNVIGGLIHVECGREHLGFLDFVSWHDQIELESDGFVHGRDYPEARWQPLVLSDPGMGGHYFDDWTSGVWKPGDEDDFYTHYPENNIIYIGEGYPHDTLLISEEQASGANIFASNGEYIKELVGKIKSGELPTGTADGEKFMYTASIHVRDTQVVSEGSTDINTAEGIRSILAELLPLEASGDIIFVDFEQAAAIWQNEYGSVPHQAGFEGFSMYQKVRNQAEQACAIQGPSH